MLAGLALSRTGLDAYAMLREVTMDDPVVVRHQAAYYRLQHPTGYQANRGQYATVPLDGMTMADVDLSMIAEPVYRRIDALLVGDRMKGTGERMRTAVEIKVSRADFRRDTDAKRRAWRSHTHRFVYLTPPGLLQPDEVPEGCGLWELTPYSPGSTYCHVVVVRKAVIEKNPLPLWDEQMATYLAARASRAEWENVQLRERTDRDLVAAARLQEENAQLRDRLRLAGQMAWLTEHYGDR